MGQLRSADWVNSAPAPVLVGIEFMHMIREDQCTIAGTDALSFAD